MSMSFPEYDNLDAVGLAELIRRGEVSAEQALEAAIERIEARNPHLEAVVHTMYDRARQRVGALPEGPLRGVPFMVKDLKLQIQGTPTSNSCKLQMRRVATQSSVLAERYEAAGVQMVGKTNTPEFGIMGITEPAVRKPCRNPWNPGHTPGGSSGGAGSAVAARMVPAAHGGDGGGSIRIPASACGLFGLKPTRGRVTMAPFAGEAWGGFVQEHVLARSVRDSAVFLDAVDAPTPGEPYGVPAKARPWIEEVGADPGKLRVAFVRSPLYAGTTHPDCEAALMDAVKLLRELGHEVVEACPSFPRAEMVRAYFLTVATGVARFVEIASEEAGKKPDPEDFEPATWLLALIAWKTSAPQLLAAQQVMQKTGRAVGAFFEAHDLMLTPTLARPPAKVGELGVTKAERVQVSLLSRLPIGALLDVALDKMGSGKLSYTPNTQLFNQTGQPAMSVPLSWSGEGLPIGVQIAARFGGEATLFRVAAQLEAARPWAHKKPKMVG
ncbi:MAG: amidase [Polyangiaceae bacterium]